MNLKACAQALCAVFAAMLFSQAANAQGVIVPIVCEIRPCPPPRPIPRPVPLPNALPVKSIKIETKIKGQTATTRVEQVLRNDTPYTLEGTYFFPLPETASVSGFAIWENGKKLVGEVRSRDEARRIYNEIVRRAKDPGLLEYAGKDLFQASIFPIPPHSDKKLELEYTQILRAESGTVGFRYPLGTGRNLWARAGRPVPLTEQRTGFDKPTPAQKFGTISGRVEIEGTGVLRNIYSPSHRVEIVRKNDSLAIVSFEASDNDNDLLLFYGISEKDFGMNFLTYREPGKDGYFLLMISPRDDVSERELIEKDIVFVIDTSGSMADAGKIEKARASLVFGINTLRAGDRFNVINFAGEEHFLESRLIAADEEGKRRGREFVKALKPNGGTNINDAVVAAIKQFDASNRPKMIVFLTDGLPTVGETDAEKIVENAAKHRTKALRLYTFGVGYDVNALLLDRLASENGGASDYVEPKEDLEIKVSSFFTKVNSPVLTELALDFGEVETEFLYPRRLPDIFKGTQLTLIGRYKNSGDVENARPRLHGKMGNRTRAFDFENMKFPRRASENDFLPRLWASRRVGWLIEQIRANGESKELKDEIVELGTRYGIVTPYTPFLAADGSEIGDREFSVSGNRLPPSKPAPLSMATGRAAVETSKTTRRLKEETRFDADEDAGVLNRSIKKIGAKTFYMENGVWTDSELKFSAPLPETSVGFASNEYFDLLTKEPELAKYFALGEQIAIVWKGKIYRIHDREK